jgi:hypothetical protein
VVVGCGVPKKIKIIEEATGLRGNFTSHPGCQTDGSAVTAHIPLFRVTSGEVAPARIAWIHIGGLEVDWHHMEVSQNGDTSPNHMLIGFSVINHSFWDTPFMETPIWFCLKQKFTWT